MTSNMTSNIISDINFWKLLKNPGLKVFSGMKVLLRFEGLV